MVLALVAPLVAGCLTTVPTVCVTDCVAAPAAAPFAPAFRWESCDGFVGFFYGPHDAVRAAVPDAFDLVDVAAGQAGLVVRGERCERGVAVASVHPDIAFFTVMARVQPKAADWSERKTGLYPLDVLVTDAGISQSLVDLGVQAQVSTLTIRNAAALDPVSADVWDFTGETLHVSAPVVRSDRATQETAELQMWFDLGGTFRRVDDSYSATVHGPGAEQAGLLTLQGTARSARIFPAEAVLWEVQPLSSVDEVWTGAVRSFTA